MPAREPTGTRKPRPFFLCCVSTTLSWQSLSGSWGWKSKGSSPFTEQAEGVKAQPIPLMTQPPYVFWHTLELACYCHCNEDNCLYALQKQLPFLQENSYQPFSNWGAAPRVVSVDSYIFVVVQSLSHLRLCDPVNCSTPGSSGLRCLLSLLEFMSMESVMLSNHLILCCSLLLLPSIFPFPPPVDHILSELFSMTRLSWVSLCLMAHSFNELCKPLHHTSPCDILRSLFHCLLILIVSMRSQW